MVKRQINVSANRGVYTAISACIFIICSCSPNIPFNSMNPMKLDHKAVAREGIKRVDAMTYAYSVLDSGFSTDGYLSASFEFSRDGDFAELLLNLDASGEECVTDKYEYLSSGDIIVKSFECNGEQINWRRHVHGAGLELEVFYYEIDSTLISRQSNSYDSLGNLQETKYYDPDGELRLLVKMKYKRDTIEELSYLRGSTLTGHSRLVKLSAKEVVWQSLQNQDVISTRVTYHYDY